MSPSGIIIISPSRNPTTSAFRSFVRRGDRIRHSSPTRTPGTDARIRNPVSSVTRPRTSTGMSPSMALMYWSALNIIHSQGEETALQDAELRFKPRVNGSRLCLDDAPADADAGICDQIESARASGFVQLIAADLQSG